MTKGGLKLKKLKRLVLGCIEAKFYKKILVGISYLAEIYTMHSFAPFSNLNFFVQNC